MNVQRTYFYFTPRLLNDHADGQNARKQKDRELLKLVNVIVGSWAVWMESECLSSNNLNTFLNNL